ncbi:MAG: OmpA family protein [Gammaproteobacteria bacterium]
MEDSDEFQENLMQAHEQHARVALAALADPEPLPRASGLRSSFIGLGVVALLAGCAGPAGPNPDLERARAEVNRAAAMPIVTRFAPLELKQATDTVQQADTRWHDKGDADEARHQAYLAVERAAIAENYARARDADEKIKEASATVDRQRLEARTREAAAARQEASEQAQRASAAEARLREIQAQQTERGLLVTLGDVLFETGKAQLLAPAFPELDKLAEFLRQYPDRRLRVEGYTDSVGGDSLNLDLSRRRAEAVRRALVQRGVSPARITIQGYGKNYPVADNSTAEGRALNRRVEVVISDERGNLRPRG